MYFCPMATYSAFAYGERDDFISVDGTNFVYSSSGDPFFFTGANNYYLGIDPYRTPGEVDEIFEDAEKMGISVMRTWGFNDGYNDVGDPGLQPEQGVYNESIFQKLDYTLYKAGQTNIRLIIPFVNNWDDYGGMNQYVDWAPDRDTTLTNNPWGQGPYHNQFYTNDNCKDYYKAHVSTILNRNNIYTCTLYKDDPAILAWELANEPRAEGDWSGDILDSWIAEMSAYVKSIDSNHLLTTGIEGFYDENGGSDWMRSGWTGTDYIRNHSHDDIDYATFHVWPDSGHWNWDYPKTMNWVQEHIDDAYTSLNDNSGSQKPKPVVLGEYGQKRDGDGGTTLRDMYFEGFLGKMYDNRCAGSNFWILYHDSYPDYDGYGVYYPADTNTISVLTDGVADSNYLMSQDLEKVVLTPGNIAYNIPPEGWGGTLTYAQDIDAPGFVGEIDLSGLLPYHAYLLSFEGAAEDIPMSAAELQQYGVSFNDGGRMTMPGGVWPESASGDYGEFEGMEVAFIDFKLIETDANGDYTGRFFFNAFGEMDPGWYYTRFIVKDAYSWTIHDETGTWRNEVLYADNIDFDPPYEPVPEPASLYLVAFGLLGAGVLKKKRMR